MIVSHNQYNVPADIQVSIWRKSETNQPFIVQLVDGLSVHLSQKDASSLHLQLTAALYEYEEEQS